MLSWGSGIRHLKESLRDDNSSGSDRNSRGQNHAKPNNGYASSNVSQSSSKTLMRTRTCPECKRPFPLTQTTEATDASNSRITSSNRNPNADKELPYTDQRPQNRQPGRAQGPQSLIPVKHNTPHTNNDAFNSRIASSNRNPNADKPPRATEQRPQSRQPERKQGPQRPITVKHNMTHMNNERNPVAASQVSTLRSMPNGGQPTQEKGPSKVSYAAAVIGSPQVHYFLVGSRKVEFSR